MFEVVSPLGTPSKVGEVRSVKRPADLSNKTIGEVINGVYFSGKVLPMIRELLQKRYPGIKVIPFTEFPTQWTMGTTQDLLERPKAAVALLRQKGCDAVITAMGG